MRASHKIKARFLCVFGSTGRNKKLALIFSSHTYSHHNHTAPRFSIDFSMWKKNELNKKLFQDLILQGIVPGKRAPSVLPCIFLAITWFKKFNHSSSVDRKTSGSPEGDNFPNRSWFEKYKIAAPKKKKEKMHFFNACVCEYIRISLSYHDRAQ